MNQNNSILSMKLKDSKDFVFLFKVHNKQTLLRLDHFFFKYSNNSI